MTPVAAYRRLEQLLGIPATDGIRDMVDEVVAHQLEVAEEFLAEMERNSSILTANAEGMERIMRHLGEPS